MSLQKAVYGFVPTSITGCQMWLDGADPAGNGVVPANNATVSTWADKSGNGLTVSAASSQPTYVTNAANGLGTVAFNGSQSLTAGSVTGEKLIGNTGNCAIFVVMRLNNSPGRSIPFSWDNETYTARLLVQYDENSILSVDKGSYPYRTQATISLSTSLYYIISYSQNGANTSLNVNGTSVATLTNFANNSITSSTRIFNVGSYANGSDWNMKGNTAEILIYNTNIPSNFQQVEGYLAQKWGLTSSLPASHPGRSTTLYRSDYTKQNVMTALPYYAVFSPRQISGCALWLDGADPAGNGVVPSQGSQIGSWIDKSGNGRTMSVQGTAANITYSKVNGINAVWFNNPSVNNAYMRNMSFQVLTTASVFMVFVPLSFSATWSFLWSWNPTASQYLLPGARIQQNNNNLQLYLTWYGSGNYGTVTNGTTYLSYFDWTNTTSMPINWSLNGTVPPTSSTVGSMINNTSVTEFDLGADLGGTYGNMYLSEMIIYNSILSSTQRQQVESYLAQKWGLTASLPGGHSHATQPAGAITRTALANLRLVVQPRRYTSFRWTITAGNTSDLIQFSEFQVGFNNTQLVFASPTTATTGSTISWNTGAGEGPAQAVDNNLNTKGLGIGTSGLVLIVTVATPIAANMYRWATANDVTPARNPTQWTVDGSADGTTFVRLHTQNTTYASPNSIFTFTSWIPFTYS